VARILVIEDEPGIARAVSEHLTAEGHVVALAADGRADRVGGREGDRT
jgi:DNA-binding response OmpR family regulator